MASKRYTVRYRRKRENKTDYKARKSLLESKLPRLVVRCKNNSVVAQIIEYIPEGDKVLVSITTKNLRDHGWNYSGGNMPSAYLAGLLLGKLAKEKSIKKAILDTGLVKVIKKSRLFAVVKGCLDVGIDIPCSKDMLPTDERCSGGNIENYAKDLLKDKAKYEKTYSRHIKRNVKPEEIIGVYKKVKESIMK